MKVKIIKLNNKYETTEEEKERIGKVFEAFKIYDEYRNCMEYAINLENGVLFLPEECCEEVIEQDNVMPEYINITGGSIIKGILLVEDGSVDTDKLEKDGFYCISYRSGAKPPMLLK